MSLLLEPCFTVDGKFDGVFIHDLSVSGGGRDQYVNTDDAVLMMFYKQHLCAILADDGVTEQTISNWESGTEQPSQSVLQKLREIIEQRNVP